MIYVAGIKIGVAFHKLKLKEKQKKKGGKMWLSVVAHVFGQAQKNKIMPFKKQDKGIKKQK